MNPISLIRLALIQNFSAIFAKTYYFNRNPIYSIAYMDFIKNA